MLVGLGAPFTAGVIVWCILALLWLVALGRGLRPRWMHLLHAFLPLAVFAACAALPPASPYLLPLMMWLAFGALILILLTPVWLYTLATHNSSVMDVVYTPAISLPALVFFLANGQYTPRQIALMAIIAVWSARLVTHAKRTNMGVSGEQQPYVKWRQQYGGNWWWLSYFQVFALQGGLIWIYAPPVVLGLATPGPLSALDLAGLALWLTGFIFQAGADWHLKQFKADPANKGRVLQTGLWSLCRHPNYFGETLIYWSYFVFALAHPFGLVSIVGPVYVTWFMSIGSATPMLDRHMLKTKPEYEDYMRRVAGFIPFLHSSGDKVLLEKHRARLAKG